MLTVAIALLVAAPQIGSISERMKAAGLVDLRPMKVAKGDLEIRHWTRAALGGSSAFLFHRKHGVWSAEFLPESIDRPAIPLRAPRSGWKGWWKKMTALDYLTLPDFDSLPGPKDNVTDGTTDFVEVNDGGKYRSYTYDNPLAQSGAWPELKKFQQVIHLTFDEFGDQLRPAKPKVVYAVKRDGKPGRWEDIYFGDPKDRQTIVGRAALSKLADLRTYAVPKDDIEIRFWMGFGITYLQGYVFRRQGGTWSGAYLLQALQENSGNDYRLTVRTPKAGWDAWWKRLNELDFLTLPDFESLPGKKATVLDGMSYVVEINRDGRYRTYMYDNPDAQPDTWPEVRKLRQIVRYLSKQFSR